MMLPGITSQAAPCSQDPPVTPLFGGNLNQDRLVLSVDRLHVLISAARYSSHHLRAAAEHVLVNVSHTPVFKDFAF